MLTLSTAGLALALLAPAQHVERTEDTVAVQFDEVDGTQVADFLELMEIQLGRPVTYEPRDVKDLRLLVSGQARVKAAEFRAYAETVLLTKGLVVLEYGPILVIRRANAAGSSHLDEAKRAAPFVPKDELMAGWEGRRQVVTTTSSLRALEADEVTDMLQTYFTDPMAQSVRGLEEANALVLTGYAESLRQVLAMVDVLDREAATAAARREDALAERVSELEERIADLEERLEAAAEDEEEG